MENYFIKNNYLLNLNNSGERVKQYTSAPVNEKYQLDCYKYARKIIKEKRITSCIELGSGSGYKLNKYIFPYCNDVFGVDLPHSIEICKKKYPNIRWLCEDFDTLTPSINKNFDLIISFDVIEHIVKPEILLNKMKQYHHDKSIILISTPERDSLHGKNHNGPPPNKLHIREWNINEFKLFIESYGFIIKKHVLLNAHDLTFKQKTSQFLKRVNYKTCQFLECIIDG